MTMLHTTELDMADTLVSSDISDFLMDATWAVHSTYHTELEASPVKAIFGTDMLSDIPFLANWKEITGNAKPFAAPNMKVSLMWTGIIQLVTKYKFTKWHPLQIK